MSRSDSDHGNCHVTNTSARTRSSAMATVMMVLAATMAMAMAHSERKMTTELHNTCMFNWIRKKKLAMAHSEHEYQQHMAFLCLAMIKVEGPEVYGSQFDAQPLWASCHILGSQAQHTEFLGNSSSDLGGTGFRTWP